MEKNYGKWETFTEIRTVFLYFCRTDLNFIRLYISVLRKYEKKFPYFSKKNSVIWKYGTQEFNLSVFCISIKWNDGNSKVL